MIDPGFAVRVAMGVAGVAANTLLQRRRPFVVNHLVTVRCNLRCPFCYVSGPEQTGFNKARYPKSSEMSTEEMRDLYAQLVQQGFKLAVVLGGEPLLRTDLPEFLSVLKDRALVTVFTNGFLLAERTELLAPATSVFVSLDAPDAQHDSLRACEGLFDRAIAGLEALRRKLPRVKIALNMTVTRANAHRVGEMLALARALRLPIGFQPPSFEGQFAIDDRPRAQSAAEAAAEEDLAAAFRRIRSASAVQKVIGSEAFFSHVIEGRATYRCHYPGYVLGPVLPNGDVVACTRSSVIGNLRRTRLSDLIDSAAFRDNARAGLGCEVGCRDWGIHDLSAALDRKFTLTDVRSYYRAFVRS